MDDKLKANLTRRETWLRGLFILVLGFLGFVGQLVLVLAVVFQFITMLVTAQPNRQLLAFSRALAEWLHQVMDYISFNRGERPWPFASWPAATSPTIDRED